MVQTSVVAITRALVRATLFAKLSAKLLFGCIQLQAVSSSAHPLQFATSVWHTVIRCMAYTVGHTAYDSLHTHPNCRR